MLPTPPSYQPTPRHLATLQRIEALTHQLGQLAVLATFALSATEFEQHRQALLSHSNDLHVLINSLAPHDTLTVGI